MKENNVGQSESQNREIKFRAWCKLDKIMLTTDKEYKDFAEKNNENYWELKCGNFSDVYLMQYTGLKDKNGLEIYEGDLIKSLDVMGDMYRLDNKGNKHLDGDCGIGEIERLDCGLWYISGQVHNGLKELIDNGHEIEIIGNIYQNPELLSEK